MASYDYDVIVIGSGAGGSVAAQQIAKSGKTVAIVEANALGGQVLNHSCIPTKALLQAASAYESAKRGATYGIRASTIGYNYPSVRAWKDTVLRATKKSYSTEHYQKQGIGVIGGRAYFIDPHTITVGKARFSAKQFIIATGSELVLPEIPGLSTSGFVTHKEAVDLNRPPKHLAIIGGGESGVEFAQLFATFGSKMTIIEKSPRLINHEDLAVSTLIAKRFNKSYGMNILTDTTVTSVSSFGLKKRLQLRRKGKTAQLTVDEIMLATGKRAVIDIGLDNAGVKYSDSQIQTDRYQRTSVKHIFAAGDCSGPYNYTHTAAYQGQVVAHNVVHSKNLVAAQYHAIPRVLFTNPQIASTGLSETELKNTGVAYNTATAPLSIIAASATTGYNDGYITVRSNKTTGALLGGTIVCPHASEMISELSLAVQYHMTAQQVAHTIHPFGTWSELLRVACAKLT